MTVQQRDRPCFVIACSYNEPREVEARMELQGDTAEDMCRSEAARAACNGEDVDPNNFSLLVRLRSFLVLIFVRFSAFPALIACATQRFSRPRSEIVTLSAMFDRTSADGFALSYTMKSNDDVHPC